MITKVTVDFLCDIETPEAAKAYITDVIRRRLKRESAIIGYTIQSHTEVLEI
jgi:hypothetical protein